jgi:hypothetical protein
MSGLSGASGRTSASPWRVLPWPNGHCRSPVSSVVDDQQLPPNAKADTEVRGLGNAECLSQACRAMARSFEMVIN